MRRETLSAQYTASSGLDQCGNLMFPAKMLIKPGIVFLAKLCNDPNSDMWHNEGFYCLHKFFFCDQTGKYNPVKDKYLTGNHSKLKAKRTNQTISFILFLLKSKQIDSSDAVRET